MLSPTPKDDSYMHKGMRKKLLDTLREKGIQDERVLAAIDNIPRHFFLDTAFERTAYEDRAFPISAGQTISQPYTVAMQSQLLQIKKFDKVLEVGTGSAYQACVLSELGASVYTIERHKALYEEVGRFFFLKKYPSIKRFYGDGFAGLPSYAPFDKMIITAAAPEIPRGLIDQLKTGGIMVLPLDSPDGAAQEMLRLTKQDDGTLSEERFGKFSFVPMLKGKE